MKASDVRLKRFQPWIAGIVTAVGSAVIFLYPSILHITKPPTLDHGDYYLVVSILRHWMDVILNGHWDTWTTLPMMYGVKNSLFFSDNHVLQALMALPWYILTRDIITTTNILSVLIMVLSVWSMYLFLYHVTRNGWASAVGSVICVYNPYVYARFPDQMILYTLFLIPLIFLLVEKNLERPTSRRLFLLFICLSAQLLSSLYYSVFLSVILPVYIGIRLWQTKVNVLRFFRIGALLGLAVFLGVTFWTYTSYHEVYAYTDIGRSTTETEYFYAAWPADWLVTAPNFIVWAPVGNSLAGILGDSIRPNSPLEMSLFWGLTPILLFISSFFWVARTRYRALWISSVTCLAIGVILSLGPRIHLTTYIALPSIYGVVAWVQPAFGYLRSVSRFAMVVFFFLSIICAMTVDTVTSNKPRAWVLCVTLLILLAVEYQKQPMQFFTPDSGLLRVYTAIQKNPEIHVVLELPMVSNMDKYIVGSRQVTNEPSRFYYQTIHGKILFNGNSGFIPPVIFERGDLVMIHFPTVPKLTLLRQWGVDAIVVHPQEYADSHAGAAVVSGLEELHVPVAAEVSTAIFFDLTKWKP